MTPRPITSSRRVPATKSRPAATARTVRGPAVSPGELEEHLRQFQRLVMQGELAATAVHEISNLLTIVLFNAGLLRERHKGEAGELKYIEPMLHASNLITTLCSQLRNLSRPTAARSQVIDLAETARGTFRLLEQIMTRELTFSAPADGPVFIYADPAQIDQMLVNLVLNARDATPDEAGRISVRVGRGPKGAGFIEVADNGSGMTADVKRQLFNSFFTTKPPGQGTGLGLVTVQRMLHGMGGSIRLTSRVGRGTCVHLQFPVPNLPEGESLPGDVTNQPDHPAQP